MIAAGIAIFNLVMQLYNLHGLTIFTWL